MLRPLAVLGTLALAAEPALAVDQAAKAFVEGAHRIYEASEWGLDLRSRPQVERYFTCSRQRKSSGVRPLPLRAEMLHGSTAIHSPTLRTGCQPRSMSWSRTARLPTARRLARVSHILALESRP